MDIKSRHGFTIIELLTCVAITAIVVAIVVPNYREAQTASDISFAKADLQSLKTGLEAYKIDLGNYPWMNSANSCLNPGYGSPSSQATLERLTTPISYLNSSTPFYDPFEADKAYEGSTFATIVTAETAAQKAAFKQYFYNARNLRDTSTWGQIDEDPYWYLLESAGPDQHHHYTWQALNSMTSDTEVTRARLSRTIYDATNGTISRGSIWVVGGVPQGTGTSMATLINAANASRVNTWQSYHDQQMK